jgi:hypothetical protein
LIAELVAGELARVLGLPVPELVLVELDAELARTEPDPEIQELIRASAGLNLALDYLPGSVSFDPVADRPDAALASDVVWFDAYTSNVDRTARNTNLLMWHRRLWLIDHGACLYFHHGTPWTAFGERVDDPFSRIGEHVLLSRAGELAAADARSAPLLTAEAIEAVVSHIPGSWLGDADGDADAQRTAYADYLIRRAQGPRSFVEEATRARLSRV